MMRISPRLASPMRGGNSLAPRIVRPGVKAQYRGMNQALTPRLAAEALPKLDQAAAHGNQDAAFVLATWFLEGRLLARDLRRARAYYERAAELGHEPSQMIAIALQAGGTGGTADWSGSLRRLRDLAALNAQAAAEFSLISKMNLDENGYPAEAPPALKVSDEPHAIALTNFATSDECAHLIALAEPRLQSAVVGNPLVSSGQFQDEVRTCRSMGFPIIAESPFIHAINRRIAKASGTDVRCGEPSQIFRYAPREEFKPHLDSSVDFPNQRTLTFLLYLNDDYEGGETHFLSSGLRYKGSRGDALMFSNVDARGDPDPASKHAGLPVIKGVKWLLSRWIRARPLDLTSPAKG